MITGSDYYSWTLYDLPAVVTINSIVLYIYIYIRGGSRIFQRGGLKAMVICINYIIYMHIAIIHIIILNEVHCNLLKAIDA